MMKNSGQLLNFSQIYQFFSFLEIFSRNSFSIQNLLSFLHPERFMNKFKLLEYIILEIFGENLTAGIKL